MVPLAFNLAPRPLRTLAAASALALLTACAAAPAPSGQAPPSSAQQGAPTGRSQTACTPVAGGLPKSAADFNCLSLVSVGGKDNSGALGWLATHPITVKTSVVDGRLTIGSETACNFYSAPLAVQGTTLSVDAGTMAATAVGCLGESGEQDQWVRTFLLNPMKYMVDGRTLVLRNSLGEIILKPAANG